ncbi:MAG: cyclic nucleotide-binding domain-containing protein [Verrucomicrobiota bacterium]
MDQSCLKQFPIIEREEGDEIIVQGSRVSGLFFLESGAVEIIKNGIHMTQINNKGASFGEMAYFLDGVSTATVRVKEPSTFRFIEDSEVLLENSPDLLLYVAKVMAHRLDAINNYLSEVKRQYGGQDNHFDLLDDILRAVIVRHPAKVPEREVPDEDDPPIPGAR